MSDKKPIAIKMKSGTHRLLRIISAYTGENQGAICERLFSAEAERLHRIAEGIGVAPPAIDGQSQRAAG